MFYFLFQGMKIFQRQQNFKAKLIEKKYICQNGKITNSISQSQNIEFVITMLKSNVERIHKRKTMNQLLNLDVQNKGFIKRKVVD
jgi:hypothetical protein